MFYVAHRLRNCSTQNSSEFLSFAFLFIDFRGIFGAHTFGKLALFFSNYGEGLYFPRQPRDNLSKAILGVNFSCGFAHSGNGLHDNEISAYSEKDFIKDIKVDKVPYPFLFSLTFPLQILPLAYL